MVKKKVVRSTRLNAEDDKKFMKLHEAYKTVHEMRTRELADLHEWTVADTLTMLIREMYIEKNLEIYEEQEESDVYEKESHSNE